MEKMVKLCSFSTIIYTVTVVPDIQLHTREVLLEPLGQTHGCSIRE